MTMVRQTRGVTRASRKVLLVVAAGLGVVLVGGLPRGAGAASAASHGGVPVGAPLRQGPCKVTPIPEPHLGRGASASSARCRERTGNRGRLSVR
jgi:hypothetical protein